MGLSKQKESRNISIESTLIVAITSKEGKLIDQHFGHAEFFTIYQAKKGSIKLLEQRAVSKYCFGSYECGEQENRMDVILKALDDCDVILTLRIGYHPQKILEAKGKKVIQTYGIIEEEINKLFF
ncbi:NifB/NifX family molybdenum-iron cluster-binding protein [Desulfitobacterium sp. Sab5]|uniref:NifB/NifX family molybdenum-iron cluster-binding protein n=1 Tax=Desulfitobacterium nosdiversum TaxID=3375356 RepID=UPI003CEB4ABF